MAKVVSMAALSSWKAGRRKNARCSGLRLSVFRDICECLFQGLFRRVAR